MNHKHNRPSTHRQRPAQGQPRPAVTSQHAGHWAAHAATSPVTPVAFQEPARRRAAEPQRPRADRSDETMHRLRTPFTPEPHRS
ncbi:hypothetical protein [Saccharopolyspora hordei]|uniref:Uncharacterized protein n=1 Tax=Saccharopolyspora hordei TaxID=1838 RepID=A0A853ATJ5_9PSEU|nr:hypothetical protein [Saccharopolyspora hordei]NYI85958.1 hypothetical protein [Saccharopolyspora hordei]